MELVCALYRVFEVGIWSCTASILWKELEMWSMKLFKRFQTLPVAKCATLLPPRQLDFLVRRACSRLALPQAPSPALAPAPGPTKIILPSSRVNFSSSSPRSKNRSRSTQTEQTPCLSAFGQHHALGESPRTTFIYRGMRKRVAIEALRLCSSSTTEPTILRAAILCATNTPTPL